MDNKYIIDKIKSYNNKYDLENKFPIFIDEKINISKNKYRDLKKLKKEILSEEKLDYMGKYTQMFDKSIEIINSRIEKYQDNKLLNFLSKFWWVIIGPILTGVVLFYLKMN